MPPKTDEELPRLPINGTPTAGEHLVREVLMDLLNELATRLLEFGRIGRLLHGQKGELCDGSVEGLVDRNGEAGVVHVDDLLRGLQERRFLLAKV